MKSKLSIKKLILSWHFLVIAVIVIGAIYLQGKIGLIPTLLLALVLACPVAYLYFWAQTSKDDQNE